MIEDRLKRKIFFWLLFGAVIGVVFSGQMVSKNHGTQPLAGVSKKDMKLWLKEIASEEKDNGQGAVRISELLNALDEGGARLNDYERLNIYYELGIVKYNLGDYASAVQFSQAAQKVLVKLIQARAIDPQKNIFYFQHISLIKAIAHLKLAIKLNCPDSLLRKIDFNSVDQACKSADQKQIDQAIATLNELLRVYPESHLAKWLLNLVHLSVNKPLDDVPASYRFSFEKFISTGKAPHFSDIADVLGLDTMGRSGSVVIEDFDADGYLDIVVSSHAIEENMKYFHNNGDGTFSDYTKQGGLEGFTGGFDLVSADYDNDGFTDILVLRGFPLDFKKVFYPNSLLRNKGDGTFMDVTAASGLADRVLSSWTAGWADYDNDGDLDLFIVNQYPDWGMGAPQDISARLNQNQLFRNNGNGTFTDVAKSAGIAQKGFAISASWGDYDEDGFSDLYISNLNALNQLYRNNKDGTFTDMSATAGVGEPLTSTVTWFWDFNNDGHLDIFVPHFSLDFSNVLGRYVNAPPQPTQHRLYLNNGNGRFTDVARSSGLHDPWAVVGGNWGDFDNDGFPDFYFGVNLFFHYALLPHLMYSNENGKFLRDVTFEAKGGYLASGHALAFGDLDNDGDQDIYHPIDGTDAFLVNPGNNNHWVTVKLIGTRSNRSAIGAKIEVNVEEDGRERKIFSFVEGGGHFGSNSLQQEIGLGGAKRIKKLEATWPASGITQTFLDVPMDIFLEIKEDEKAYKILQRKKIEFPSKD